MAVSFSALMLASSSTSKSRCHRWPSAANCTVTSSKTAAPASRGERVEGGSTQARSFLIFPSPGARIDCVRTKHAAVGYPPDIEYSKATLLHLPQELHDTRSSLCGGLLDTK